MTFEKTDRLDEQLDALSENLSQTSTAFESLKKQLESTEEQTKATKESTKALQDTVSGELKDAFRSIALGGQDVSTALTTLAQNLVQTVFEDSVTNVTDGLAKSLGDNIGNVFGNMMTFANGGSFAQGRVTPFATGGVVSQPTYFPMRGGTGLMGEAGPEAIMPLSRGSDGKLGVRAQGGGGPVNVVMNIQTPDAKSFERSRSQIAAQMNRALAQGQRNR